MELLYVWIKSYKNIERCGFNFGGEFLFSYDEEERLLNYQKNENYIDGFFNIDNQKGSISNITGIVGKNGVGKSSLLSFLIPRLAAGYNESDFFPDCIIILKTATEIKVITSKQYQNFRSKPSKISAYPVVYSTNFNPLSNLDLIYYNPGWHDTVNHDVSGLNNISTRNLFEKKDITYHRNDHSSKLSITLAKAINIHELEEGIRKVSFLKKMDSFDFKLKFPAKLVLHLKKVGVSEEKSSYDYNKNAQSGGQPSEDHYYFILNRFFTKIDKADYFNNNDKDYFRYLLYRSLVYHSIHDAGRSSKFLVYQFKGFDFSEENVLDRIKSILIDCFYQDEFKEHKGEEIPYLYPKNKEYGKAVWEVLDAIDSFLERYTPIRGNNGSINLFVDIKRDSDRITSFLTKYFRTIILTTHYLYLDFSHTDEYRTVLSTGEERYLSMVSRFFSLTDEEVFGDNSKLKSNIIIFLDETELYFHPEWQQDFIRLLVEFLPQIYPKRTIQVILTSHSPFIISDLPANNIIFLESKTDGTCNVLPSDNMRSFGANIHHLLKDAFFMGSGLMGKFAEKKINNVIVWLNNIGELGVDIAGDKTYQEMRKVISMVDEPMIKNKLLSMLAEKLGDRNKYELQQLFEEQVAILRKKMGLSDDTDTSN